jgi:hypothetical protein
VQNLVNAKIRLLVVFPETAFSVCLWCAWEGVVKEVSEGWGEARSDSEGERGVAKSSSRRSVNEDMGLTRRRGLRRYSGG